MKRIVIKLSGEGLSNKEKGLLIDSKIVDGLVKQIKKIKNNGYEVGIIIGGGNFWRGQSAEKKGMPRVRADYIGMIATLMNALALQSAFEKESITARVQSSIGVDEKIAQNYVNEKSVKYLENKEIVIFAGGTGRPYFTTDTAATLVASEIGAKLILMGKNGVKGVYDSDPKQNPNANKFDLITYDEIIEKNLKVMDITAASMAKDNNLEVIVFDITEENALERALNEKIEHTKLKR